MPSLALALLLPALLSFPGDDTPNEKIDALARRWADEDTAGLAIAVVKDGRVRFIQTYGLADVETGEPNRRETSFKIASTSKQFTAACVLRLARSGKLSLEDDVRKWFPELPDYGEKITVAQLLQHRSGIRDVYEVAIFHDLDTAVELKDNAAVIALIARQKALNFPPGRDMLYSNSGYFLAAEIVRRASGQSLRSYAAEHLFGPLGMKNTAFDDDLEPQVQHLAQGHDRAGDGSYQRHPVKVPLHGPGGLVTSIDDLVQWVRAFDDPKWKDLLAGLLAEPVLSDGDRLHPAMSGYRMGLMVDDQDSGVPLVHHAGGSFGFGAEIVRIPCEHLAVIVLANSQNPPCAKLAREIYSIVREDPHYAPCPRKEVAQPAIDASRIPKTSGLHRDTETGTLWLVLPSRGFAKTLHARLVLPRQASELPATLEPLTPWSPTGSALEEFAGRYRSDELGAEVEWEVEGGKLHFVQRHPMLKVPAWDPATADTFVIRLGAQVDFQRDGKGKIRGYTASSGRARGMRFTRVR